MERIIKEVYNQPTTAPYSQTFTESTNLLHIIVRIAHSYVLRINAAKTK